MMKTIFTNKTTGEQLELVKKEGQLYTLKTADGTLKQLYRIVLTKYFNKTEQEICNVYDDSEDAAYIADVNAELERMIAQQMQQSQEVEEEQPTNITTRTNKKHSQINIVDPKGMDLQFNSVKEFATYLEAEYGKKINKGHLYNLINGKSKSYLGYRVAQ